ncbi:hypothetical protein HMSSN139_68360 [Paenibacillus sp. HMSSN-139]|nr:hypothetical protein HMSSN139_68360 [Paenibacillus sp. HMSSN-139]
MGMRYGVSFGGWLVLEGRVTELGRAVGMKGGSRMEWSNIGSLGPGVHMAEKNGIALGE